MKKTFKLSGLECANCAAKIENGIKKLDGVTSASLNFMTTKLVVEGEDSKMDAILESAKTIIKKLEPDIIMQKV